MHLDMMHKVTDSNGVTCSSKNYAKEVQWKSKGK